LRIEVEDNGRGMGETSPDRNGHGLENLRNRTAQIGGQLEVQSRPGQGTKITIKLKVP
jgi:signal transduction histidine kinase